MHISRNLILVFVLMLGTLAFAAGPAISSISPMSATAGDSAFTLIVNGANFKNTSTVLWNGAQRTTTYVNGSTLQAAISAADLAAGGTASITVQTGSVISTAVTFTINAAASSDAAAITSITPLATPAGSTNFTLVVNGAAFSSTSLVSWNGTTLPTTFVNSSTLNAQLVASDVAAASVIPVAVMDGGTQSNTVSFTITATTAPPPPPPPPPPPTTNGVVVTVTSPTPNQVICGTTTPVTVSASAVTGNAGAMIDAWWVYDNGIDVWSTFVITPTMSTTVLLAGGPHTIQVTAWDTTGASSSVNVPVTVNASCGGSGPGGAGPIGNWQGFMYNDGGNLDQAISFTVAQAGSYAFNGTLYYGSTCDPTQFTDQIGFGNPISFGANGYTFWFIHYPNNRNTSAIWTVGTQSSGCISYANAPVQ